MSEFKVGDKVCVLKNVRTNHSINAIGKIIEFDERDSTLPYNVDVHGQEGWYEASDLELIPNKNQRITSLEETVEQQQNEINELKVLVHQLRDNTTIVVKEDIKSNNELRAEVIEKSKKIIESEDKMLNKCAYRGYINEKCKSRKICDAEFIVNADKKTVVCLLKWLGEVTYKGIAKCMPSDVFNEHIGKAIALGRALNIDVSEFENAVQPDSIVLGMLVKDKNASLMDASGTVCELKKGAFGSPGYKNEKGKWNSFEYSEIIDDTNAIYEVK